MNNADKHILFTGATGGLAKETIKCLLEQDVASITLAGRSEKKLAAVKSGIVNDLGHHVEKKLKLAAGFDMNSPEKLFVAVNRLPKQAFDIVCLGAGAASFGNQRQTISYAGRRYEKTIFQNVIGGHITLSYLITLQLIGANARVITIGGEGARGIKGMIAKPEFNDPNTLSRYVFAETDMKYNAMNALGSSKLIAALWSQVLGDYAGEAFSSIWFSPGFIYGTGGTNGLPKWQDWFAQNVVFKLMAKMGMAQSPKEAGEKLAQCLLGHVGHNGDILGAPEGKTIGALTDQKPMNSAFTNKALQARVWTIFNDIQPLTLAPFHTTRDKTHA